MLRETLSFVWNFVKEQFGNIVKFAGKVVSSVFGIFKNGADTLAPLAVAETVTEGAVEVVTEVVPSVVEGITEVVVETASVAM